MPSRITVDSSPCRKAISLSWKHDTSWFAILLGSLRSRLVGRSGFRVNRKAFALKGLNGAGDKSRLAAETLMKATAFSDLNGSVAG
jgi:hypothetical protein